jgi:hypothetical protein
MTETHNVAPVVPSIEEIQKDWHELMLRVAQLEKDKSLLEQENKAIRFLLERVIDHRQKSHTELVMVLTNLVSKLPLNDVGGIVSRLVEHNTNLSHYLAALIKGTAEVAVPEPAFLKTLDHSKRELAASIKPVVEELIALDTPLEKDMLQALIAKPEEFFSTRMLRANRCFLKGQVPRERVLREFGDQAILFFNDMTTDPKLNPRPKADEIALAFKSDFDAQLQQNPGVLPEKRPQIAALHEKVQRSKAANDHARAQRSAFIRMSFLIELLHYYEHQNTEASDVIFAQRLPALVEQLVLLGPQEVPDEKLIITAEGLMAHVINPDHRQMIVNNVGKGSTAGKTLKYVLRLRSEKVPDLDHVVAEFVRHLVPTPQRAPNAQGVAALLKLLRPEMQRVVVRAIFVCDRLSKEQAEALGADLAKSLGLTGAEQEAKAEPALPPEIERQMAWARVKDMIVRRNDAATVATAIRERLHAKYDAEEIRQSWITLTEADAIALIRIFCQLPYLSSGQTDPIARPVIETYVTRLMHEKYISTYHKILKSLKSMFAARPDSPTLINFIALVRWVDHQAADRIAAEVGMPVPAH